MANLNYQRSKVAGTALTFTPASGGGDKLPVNPNGALLVRNNDASSKTVTVVVPGNTKYGQPDPDVATVIAAGATAAIGPFPADLADPDDHLVHITYSAVTSVTVAALDIS